MGRKRKNDGLQAFGSWLQWEQHLAPGTINVYVSYTRAVVQALGEKIADREAVHAHFAELWTNAPDRYRQTKRPWTLFVEWARTKGVAVAEPGEMGLDSKKALASLPAEVLQALNFLVGRQLIPMKIVPFLTWADVQPYKDSWYYVQDIRAQQTFLQVPKEPIDVLKAHAAPRPGEMIPLIPSTPGGREPYPGRALIRELSRYRRSNAVEEFNSLAEQYAENRAATARNQQPCEFDEATGTFVSATDEGTGDLADLLKWDPDEDG